MAAFAAAARSNSIRSTFGTSTTLAACFREHRDADQVLHLAAQVAVTTSVKNPREDFEINALGTFNVLEAMRQSGMRAPLIYSSTNKVYGEMTSVGTVERNGRYDYQSLPTGVSEEHNLDFHSPYGCSKGSADQYVIDYHRIYGMRTTVFRQSCIYGYRQFGAEDQGWVAWFMIASQLGRPITIYGDGKQVRDILFIDDLLDAYDAAFAAGDKAAGRAFNIGGGVATSCRFAGSAGIHRAAQRRKIRARQRRLETRSGTRKVSSAISAAPAPNSDGPQIRLQQGRDCCTIGGKNRELFLKLSRPGMRLAPE